MICDVGLISTLLFEYQGHVLLVLGKFYVTYKLGIPHLSAVGYLTSQPIKLGIPHPSLSKTGQITLKRFCTVVPFYLFRMNHQKIIEKS